MLIERAKTKTLDGYKEIHHIIPKCLGETDVKENLVSLTPEEHYLLVKMYSKSTPLVNVAVIMTIHHTDKRANNKLYGWLRRRASITEKQRIAKNGHPRGMLGKNYNPDNISKITSGIKKKAQEKRIAKK